MPGLKSRVVVGTLLGTIRVAAKPGGGQSMLRCVGTASFVRIDRAIIPLVVVVLIASACSSDGEVATTTGQSSSTSTSEPATVTSVTSAPEDSDVRSDFGVDAATKTITLGILADLTGPFASLAADVTDAQQVYWDLINESGGIDGWTIEIELRDTRNSVEQHQEAYAEIRDEVVALSHSTGSTTNLETLDRYVEDAMLVIPLSWFSGWAIPRLDGRVMFEQNTNFCIEAMNILDFIADMGGRTLAVVTSDDDYGRDAAAGVSVAAAHYGLPIVYNGVGAIVPGEELGEALSGIVESNADWTFLATSPSLGAQVIAGAVLSGYPGLFAGSTPSYDGRLLDSASAELYDTRFYQSSYTVEWGENSPGNNAMMKAMTDAFPDRRPSDSFIIGWNAGIAMRSVLSTAIARGDLTRSGVIAAANSIAEVDFGGSAPVQSYVGVPNDLVTRQSAILKPDLATYLAAGGAGQTLAQEGATAGSIVVRPFFVGDAAAHFEFTAPCSAGE